MKKRRFITFADIVLIIAVCALTYGAIELSAPTAAVSRPDDVRIRYTVELGERRELGERIPIRAGFHERIQTGELLFDSLRDFEIGTIAAVYALPYMMDVADEENDIFRRVPVDGLEYVYIVVEASAQISDYSTAIGAYEIAVGRDVYVRSKHFAGEGFVVAIERLDG